MFKWIKDSSTRSLFNRRSADRKTVYSNLPTKDSFFNGHHVSPLAYKYGYIACLNGVHDGLAKYESITHWNKLEVGDLTVAHHPATNCKSLDAGGRHLVLVGEVFNPYSKEFSSEVILDELMARLANESLFLDYLDELSGRFVLFLKKGHEWRTCSDAFSARSIFYDSGFHGVVASHAALLANLTGDDIDFNMLAFTQSKAYQKRDVKYFPGRRTIWSHIYYCPANHFINIRNGVTERFWPRKEEINEEPESSLIQYLDGYSDYIKQNYDREIFGLTAGLDSRTMLAPLIAKEMPMTTFTLNRGDGGMKDIQIAREISESMSVEHKTLTIAYDHMSRSYFTEAMQVLRQSTGFARLNSPFANVCLYEMFKEIAEKEKLSYSRGFGGEILRGFYQNKSGSISQPSALDFSAAYDVLAGSELVQSSFMHFIQSSRFDSLEGVDLNDIFYWEHRMSNWASLALAETDLTACTYIGYNSRRLYKSFLMKSFDHRIQRKEFRAAINYFKPELLDFEVA